jgi:indole-3-glycerol phosphate synthase / phosphoribosylanthranilate isomerase
MPAILVEIVANKKEELKIRKTNAPLSVIKSAATAGDGSFAAALKGSSLKLICELKPKSPSAGVLQASPDIGKILAHYNKYASAISVLTDEKYFGGSLHLLTEVANQSPHPVLCKDFIIDTYQCFEARQAGAQAVLLIVKILEDDIMSELHETTIALGMTPVVEVQCQSELDRALKLRPEVILINNRNLETFDIQFQTTLELAPQIPDNIIRIAASGVSEKSDIERLLHCCSNFLVGSSLMSAPDLGGKLEELASARTSLTQESRC